MRAGGDCKSVGAYLATLYLVRHAQPELTGTFLGQADPPLAAGALDHVGTKIAALRVLAAYVSPLRRAHETAITLPTTNVTVMPELREISFGDWTAKTWTEIEREWPVLAARKLDDWQAVTPPGGEDWTEFVARVGAAWNLIRRGPSPAAVIAHQGVNAVLANLAAGMSFLSFQQSYGEIIELTYAVD